MRLEGQAHVGFGRASLWGTWTTDRRKADEIDVRALAARCGEGVAVLAVADFMELWPATCERIRDAVAEDLAVDRGAVGVFATQNHGVEGGGPPAVDVDGVARAFVDACREAMRNVEPAEVAMVAARPDPPLNVCRRIRFQDFGAFTFWFGYRVDEGGRADVSHLIRLALSQMAEGQRVYPLRCAYLPGDGADAAYDVPEAPIPLPSPQYLPPAADSLVQGLFFRVAAGPRRGQPIGSLVRFPTHPNVANLPKADWTSGDYPEYVRRRLEEAFGGTAMFATGPCGDSCSLVDRKSLELARKLGMHVADAALAAMSAAKWQPAGPVRAITQPVELRIRPDVPASVEEAKATCGRLEEEYRAAAKGGRPLAEIKRLLERWEVPSYIASGALRSWTGIDACGRAGEVFTHPLPVARIGPAVIAGLPGEPFGGISVRLRNETLGDGLIVCEAGNGFLSYIPTAEEYPLGGYGPCAALCDATSEERLVAAVRTAMARL